MRSSLKQELGLLWGDYQEEVSGFSVGGEGEGEANISLSIQIFYQKIFTLIEEIFSQTY